MLQSMRNNLKGTVAIIIVGFLAFVLIGGLLQFAGNDNHSRGEVASIDGTAITELDLLRAIEGRRRQLSAQLGDQLPPELLSNENLRPLALENLLNYHLLVGQAVDGKMTVSDQSLNEHIAALPQFQVDGSYSPERFRGWLNNMLYTVPTFKNALKQEIIADQVQRALIDSGFVTDADWTAATRLALQTRDFDSMTLPLGTLQQQVVVTEEEIQAFYDENKENYLSAEQVAVEYIEITVDDIADAITIDADVVREQYEQEVAAYEAQTQREAAHILIEDGEGADERVAEVEAALAAGEDFASLAERYSDDIGSKGAGGVLGFTSGDIFPPRFETALESLTVGEVSIPVTTEAGTHFIKLVSVQSTQAPSFEEEQQRIEQQLKLTEAEDVFIEALDMLKDLSYNAESLADVATKISDDNITLTASQTELFARTDVPSILSSSAVNDAIFSDKVIKEGYASDVIEIAEDHAVVVKMTDYQPVRMLAFEEKRDEIEATIRLEKAKSQLLARAETLREAVIAGNSLVSVATAQGLDSSIHVGSDRNDSEVDEELLEFVFSMRRPIAGNSVIDGAHLSNGDYVLVHLSKVEDAAIDSLSEPEKVSQRNSIARIQSLDEFSAWRYQVRSDADIEVFIEADRANLL